MSGEGRLETRRLSKHFGAVVALHEFNLWIGLGEVVALAGDNGAGKSTLVKLLSGAQLASSCEMMINDRVVSIDAPARARSFGIATIYQELALVDNLTVMVDHPIIGAFRDASRAALHPFELWGIGAHTDMGIPTDLGKTPTVNFGPGDPSQAHQPNESVSLADLITTTKIIALTIANGAADASTQVNEHKSTVSRGELGQQFDTR